MHQPRSVSRVSAHFSFARKKCGLTSAGYAIAAYGVTGPSLGAFAITIDDNRVATLSARSDVEAHGVLLYYTTNLDPNVDHTMVLEALDGGSGGQVGLVVDRWQAWGAEGMTSFR